jgi:hypothetical protein
LDDLESYSHAFFIRVWIEEAAAGAGRATWRGSIIHLPDGRPQYIQELEAITSLVRRYLSEMGVEA